MEWCLEYSLSAISKNDGLNFTERIWGKTQHSCVARLFSKSIGEVGSFYHYVDCLLRLLKWQTFNGNLCHIRKLWYRNYFCCEGIHRVWPKGLSIKKINLNFTNILFHIFITESYYMQSNYGLSSSNFNSLTHICVSKLSILGSDNGLSPGRQQAII